MNAAIETPFFIWYYKKHDVSFEMKDWDVISYMKRLWVNEKESKMKLVDTIELLTEILVGKKEETRSQKKTRTTNVKTKRKTTKKKKI